MRLLADARGSLLSGAGDAAGHAQSLDTAHFVQVVVNALVFIIGAVAVIMLIVGGLRYVASGGDPKATKGAKDTILYAIVGVVVAVLAYAAVHFVLGKI